MKSCEKLNNLALQQLKATFSFFFVNKPKKFNLKHKRKLQGQLFCHAIFENVQHKLSNFLRFWAERNSTTLESQNIHQRFKK